jgi:hypothetical protein
MRGSCRADACPFWSHVQYLASELATTITSGAVWLAIAQGLILALACFLLGRWAARRVGLLATGAPAGETLGVGLASGLLLVAAGWAAVASGGRSAFTPVAIAFIVALALTVRGRPGDRIEGLPPASAHDPDSTPATRGGSVVRAIGTALLAAGVIAGIGILYGSTMTLSPRDGLQPVEFMDEAFYSILGADLASTGTETTYLPSGFTDLVGIPPQIWYHWGELWLASAAISIFDTDPLAARHVMVLPTLLLAAGALAGTLVRRATRTTSRRAFVLGFVACLFLAPVPTIPGPYFASWAVGLVFGITTYGLAAVAVLLVMYCLFVLPTRHDGWALAGFAGTSVAFLFPAHIIVAVLGLIGVGSAWTIWVAQVRRSTGRWPVVSPTWRRTIAWAGVTVILTGIWGLVTGHGIAGSAPSTAVTAFNASWQASLAITALGAGALAAIPVMWVLVRRTEYTLAGLYLGTCALLVAGAIAWGARLSDFNFFHVFFAGVAVFAAPVAAIAVWSLLQRLQTAGRRRLALIVVALLVVQLEVGVATTTLRLQRFGPHDYPPTPVALLDAVEALPADAKLAYSCRPFDEFAFWLSKLLSIDAHTGRRMIPMCFEADFLGIPDGVPLSPDVMNPLFTWAPQRALYPDASAMPSPAEVAAFMRAHDIGYIYADPGHPNTLVPDARVVASVDGFEVLELP